MNIIAIVLVIIACALWRAKRAGVELEWLIACTEFAVADELRAGVDACAEPE